MKVLVCVKPIREELLFPDRKQNGKYMINPYELEALKNILSLREKRDYITITCLCLGPESAKNVLTRCLGLGADEAVLLSDACFCGSDSLATSLALYQAISHLGHFDLIICGAKSMDGETGQVPFGLAERLGYQWQTNVTELLDMDKKRLVLKKAEKDIVTIVETDTPQVLIYHSFEVDIETMGLMEIKKARKRKILLMRHDDIEIDQNCCGLPGSRTKVVGSTLVSFNKTNIKVDGTSQEKADFIINTLKQIKLGANQHG